MIDIGRESLISLKTATQLLPTPPTPSCVWRWWKHGVRGIRLETVVIGGRRYTSHEALLRFIRGTTDAFGSESNEPDSPVHDGACTHTRQQNDSESGGRDA